MCKGLSPDQSNNSPADNWASLLFFQQHNRSQTQAQGMG